MTPPVSYLLSFAAAALFCSLQFGITARVAHGESACPNEYQYTQQPPEDIACNPYVKGTLRLHCAVTGPEDLEIRWYFSHSSNSMDIFSEDTELLTETAGGRYSFIVLPIENGVGQGLIVHNLNSTEDHGSYWCQAFLSDGSYYLSATMAFLLFEESLLIFIKDPCPDAFLTSSDPRCAELMEIVVPPVTTNVPVITSAVANALPSSPVVQIGATTALLLPQTLTAGTSPTPMPLTPTRVTTNPANPNPSPTEITTGSTTDPQTDPPADSKTMDTVTFYAAMGTAGFLVVVVVALVVVILILCRKRCHRVGLVGTEKNKESGFEQLSMQSDLSGVFKRTAYRHNISTQIQGTSRSEHSSGDYAEIGPALLTLRSQTHDYSEIPDFQPPLPPIPLSTMPGGVSNRYSPHEDELDTYLPPADRENPYDLPVHATNVTAQQLQESPQQQDRAPPPTSPPPPPPPPSNYQIFEKVPKPTETVASEKLASSSPPFHPHDYHVLERQPESEVEESSISQLETIPEHPYHILEEQAEENSESLESTIVPSLPDIGIKEATPGFTDPEIEERMSESGNQFTASTADGDYDRLVDPPQLYRLLEHSPSLIQPRIREFPVRGYHLSNISENVGGVRYLSPQTEETTLSSKSGTLSDTSSEVVFDDPQYTMSPRRTVPALKIETRSHGHGKSSGHVQESVRDADEQDLSKYLGDYERDPSYMEQLHQRSSENSARGSTGSDDYPNSTYSLLTSGALLLPKGASSDFPHVYQSLETETMDPRQQYEKLRKQDSVGLETVI